VAPNEGYGRGAECWVDLWRWMSLLKNTYWDSIGDLRVSWGIEILSDEVCITETDGVEGVGEREVDEQFRGRV